MKRVEMIVGGRRALVDPDMVRKMTRKEQLVATCVYLRDKMEKEHDLKAFGLLSDSLDDTITKIVRLNRTIRQNVYFFPKEAA
jgi:hypothetical protein